MPGGIHHTQIGWRQGSFDQFTHPSLDRLRRVCGVVLLHSRKIDFIVLTSCLDSYAITILIWIADKNYECDIFIAQCWHTSSEKDWGAIPLILEITLSTLVVIFCSRSNGLMPAGTGAVGTPIGLLHDQENSSSRKNMPSWYQMWLLCWKVPIIRVIKQLNTEK